MKLPKRFFSPRMHPHDTVHPHGSQTLDQLPAGSRAIISTLSGGKHISSRLATIGLTVGTEIQVLQNYQHGPIILSVRGVRLALGRGEASKIKVIST